MDTEEASCREPPIDRFLVAGWLIEPAAGQISRGGDTVRVEPKAMEVLAYLVRRYGEVVTREELEREVWRGALVGYDAVTSTVIKLRKALGDSAKQSTIIRTIPKRGYQLMVPATPVGDAQGPPVVNPAAAPDPEASQVRRFGLVSTAAALLAVVAIGLGVSYFAIQNMPSPEHSPFRASRADLPSIVVLPFENLSDSPEQEQFADGITEDIITDLSGLSDLLVLASNTSFSYKGRQTTPEQVASDLHVGFILEGSVRRQGESVRVNARLVDAESGYQIWANRFDRKVTEIFAVQDEVTNSIVEALAVNLTPQEKIRLSQKTTDNLIAYDHFREGQRLAHISSRDSNPKAQEAYRRAIQADPSYGRAYGALAYTMAYSYRRGWTDTPVQTIDLALELAKDAVRLDDSIPQTFWALGYVHLMRKEYDQAEAAVTRAIAVAPNYADGYGLLALIKNALGDAEAVIELIEKGMKLNPYYTWDYPYNLGRAYYTLGRYDDAVEVLEQARTRNENAVPIRLFLAASYVRAGRQDDAKWEAEEIQVLSPTDTISHFRNTLPIKDEASLEAMISDLRETGLPE